MKIQNKSFYLYEGIPYEMVFNEDEKTTQFVGVGENGGVEFRDSFVEGEITILPFSPENDLLKNSVVLFPSHPVDYGSEKELIEEIRSFVHKYLEISPFFEKLVPFYVLFTWMYDQFKELPYLRALADYGNGKSRFLKAIGALCYKPMFTVGATTTAPIFRLIDQFKGTLVLDEADLRFSDTNVEIVKILNNGFQAGMPVLRCGDGANDYEIKAFHVFCPKIVATRNRFQDKALESRFLVEYMDGKLTRKDIPLNLNDDFDKEALEIRNRCLMWRLKNYGVTKKCEMLSDSSIQPRLNQIISPLASIIEDEDVRSGLIEFVREYNKELVIDKGLSFEAPILEVIIKLMHEAQGDITMKSISERYNLECLVGGDREMSPRKVGSIIRDKFRLKTVRTRDGYILSRESYDKNIDRLCSSYGIDRELVNDVNVVEGDDIERTLKEIGMI